MFVHTELCLQAFSVYKCVLLCCVCTNTKFSINKPALPHLHKEKACTEQKNLFLVCTHSIVFTSLFCLQMCPALLRLYKYKVWYKYNCLAASAKTKRLVQTKLPVLTNIIPPTQKFLGAGALFSKRPRWGSRGQSPWGEGAFFKKAPVGVQGAKPLGGGSFFQKHPPRKKPPITLPCSFVLL